MSIENAAIEQELQRRQVQDAAATRDTANIRRIAKAVLIAGWCAPIIPFIGLFGLFVSFWAGVGTGTYLLIAGARKSGFSYILAGFLGTLAVGALWAIIYLVVGIGGGSLL